MIELFFQLTEILLAIVKEFGYLGIFLGMTIESSFFPFPSEIVLVPAGALIAKGEMTFMAVFIAGLLGSLTGALINFFLALFLGRTAVDFLISKYGKIIFLNKAKLKQSDDFFNKHGGITTFIGRFIPVIRQLISIPAGFSRMNLLKFCLYTSLGAGIWALILIYIGYFFGNNSELITQNVHAILWTLLFSSLIISITYIILNKKRSVKKSKLKQSAIFKKKIIKKISIIC